MAEPTLHEKMMQMHGGSAEGGHKMLAMKKASYEVALKGKRQIAEGTMAFVFEKPKGFQFKAGQHIRMTLIDPPETDAEGNSRFFSLANTPQDKDLVIAMRMRDTAFKHVLGRMQTGEKVLIQILLGVPHGAFALHDDASIPAIFLVGGIGIVPAFSMIKDATVRKLPYMMTLFYSNRRPQDAPYLDELEKLAKQNPNFKLIATITEAEKSAKSWQGQTGRIDRSMLRQYVDDLKAPIYYVSGLPEMVSSMKALLAELGVSEDNIHVEEFTGFNLNELHKSTDNKSTSHLVLIAIILLIVGTVAVHFTGTNSIFHSGLGSLSFSNPLSYLLVGLLLVVVIFKLKLLWRMRHVKGKHVMREIKDMHRLGRKR